LNLFIPSHEQTPDAADATSAEIPYTASSMRLVVATNLICVEKPNVDENVPHKIAATLVHLRSNHRGNSNVYL
jgi:hypothetical protein